jgi:dihydrofolate reductase
MKKIIIAAVSENNVIGSNGQIPWHIPRDLKRFKDLTLDHTVIMGRVTYDSILEKLGRSLPQRKNIILSNNPSLSYPDKNLTICSSIEKAFEEAKKFSDEAYIIGGEKVYLQTMDLADKLEITRVHQDYQGDTFFPKIDYDIWKETKKEGGIHDSLAYSFITYERR